MFADDAITANQVLMAAIQAAVTVMLALTGVATAYIALKRELKKNTEATEETQKSVVKTQESVQRTEVAVSKAAANTIVAAKLARDVSVKTDTAMADLQKKIAESKSRIDAIVRGDSDKNPTG